MIHRPGPLSLASAVIFFSSVPARGQQPGAAYSKTMTQGGTSVTVNIDRVDAKSPASESLREFENVVVQVRLTDTASKSPIAGGSPAAWIDRRSGDRQTTPTQCTAKVKRFAEGSTFSRTELDLTSYFVVIMNGDPTLTVVDPRFGYGDTRLLAMVTLDGPGEDWTPSADGKRLFVSVPSANEVVVIDAASWKVIAAAREIPRAARLALQPDEAYLWAADGGDNGESGVTILNPRDMKVVARIPTGPGYHHLAFTEDSSFAFVSNPQGGTVSVIDVRKLEKIKDVPVGIKPTWITYSGLAKAAYVANEGDGKIVAIDAVDHAIRSTMTATPGLGQIRFAPGGRFALVVNPNDNYIYVIDAVSNQIVQKGKLDKGPNQIAFTNKTAHIRLKGSDEVLMIALESLGQAGADISVADFSGGRNPPGAMSRPSPADGIVQASGENAVLVANPGDKAVYFYMEGSAAPMGNLSNYGHEPRAVLSVDRNLRERSPGVYETTTTLPAAGSYDFALFLDRPLIVSCVDLQVAPDPLHKPDAPKRQVEPRIVASAMVGEPVRAQFRIGFANDGKPDTAETRDVVILMAGPSWQHRDAAVHLGDGIYAVDFTIPVSGIYNVYLSSPSRGLPYRQYATVIVRSKAN